MHISIKKIIKSSPFFKSVCFLVLLVCLASCTSVLDDMSDEVVGIVGEDGTFSCVFSGKTVEECLSEEVNGNEEIAENNSIEGDSFPSLGDVPTGSRASSTVEDLERLTDGLIADRDDARYTNELLRSSYATGEDKLSKVEDGYDSGNNLANLDSQRGMQSSKIIVTDSLAKERRIISATEAVLDQGYSAKEQAKGLQEGLNILPRDQIDNEPEAIPVKRPVRIETQNGVITNANFRKMFDDAFESSGASTYSGTSSPVDIEVVNKLSSEKLEKYNIKSVENGAYQNDVVSVKNSIQLAKSDRHSFERAMISFQVASVPFAVGSAVLDNSHTVILKKVVRLFKQFGGVIRVVGHASQRTRDMDPDKHEWVNFNISMDRAENTAIRLARLGIPANSIIIMARSDSEQLSDEHMPSTESENRRADIYIEY